MITRNTNIVGAAVLFGLLAAAAVIWGYSMMNLQHGEASVEVQQLHERSWGVEIKEMPADADLANEETRKVAVTEH